MAEPPITQGGAYAPARRREPRPRLPPPPASAQAEPEAVGGTFCFPRGSSRGLKDEEEQRFSKPFFWSRLGRWEG